MLDVLYWVGLDLIFFWLGVAVGLVKVGIDLVATWGSGVGMVSGTSCLECRLGLISTCALYPRAHKGIKGQWHLD
jgi:hypothetical protein